MVSNSAVNPRYPAEHNQDAEEDLPVLLGWEGQRRKSEHQEGGDAKAVEEPEELRIREEGSGYGGPRRPRKRSLAASSQ